MICNKIYIIKIKMEGEEYDYMFKIIIIGNTNTGKSSLMHYFTQNQCSVFAVFVDKLEKINPTTTIGGDVGSYIFKFSQKRIKL